MKRTLFLVLFCAGVSFASTSISTVTCSGQTVTVNATAHGLAQYQGFSIQGTSVSTYNINSTAATVAANSLTFTLPNGTSCNGSASGGTIQAAKQIINIGSAPTASGNITINYVMWLTTSKPTITTATSVWSGASAAENAAIQAGTTVEVSGSITVSPGTSAASISTTLTTTYSQIEASINSGFLGYTGYWWNGASWVNQ